MIAAVPRGSGHANRRDHGSRPLAASAARHLLDALARLAGLLDAPQDTRILAPLCRREVLGRLLTGRQGAVVGQIGLADGNLAHLTRTV